MDSSFDQVIAEHLELKRRNGALEEKLPLARYLEQPAATPEIAQPPAADPDSWWDSAATTWESLPAFGWSTG